MARAGATGTARMTFAAPSCRATWQAALAVDPVAIPSSTITAVRPARSRRRRPWRKRATLLSSRARSRRSTCCRSSWETRAMEMVRGSRTRTLPSPMAPMATSGWKGTPSFRTTITSSGASRALATSNATGTPPLGRPSTTTSGPRRPASRFPSRRPASDLSWNDTIAVTRRVWFGLSKVARGRSPPWPPVLRERPRIPLRSAAPQPWRTPPANARRGRCGGGRCWA